MCIRDRLKNYYYTFAYDELVTGNHISKAAGVDRSKAPVAQLGTHVTKRCFKRNPHAKSVLVQKQMGIQLKTGAVFCLPAKSSHSSRIIIPNKRFLEDDYHKVEVSPKKPKVEHLSADVKKAGTPTVPSTYRCSLGTRKRLKSESGDTASDVPCEPVIVVEDKAHIGVDDSQCEAGHTEHQTSDVNNQDSQLADKNEEPESMREKESVKNKSVTESCESVAVTSVSSPEVVTGSILQKPKLCLDQTAVDRSTLAFAKSLRSQMAEEGESDSPSQSHVACSSGTGSVSSFDVCSVNSSSQITNSTPSTPSRTCHSWNARTGKLCKKIVKCCDKTY